MFGYERGEVIGQPAFILDPSNTSRHWCAETNIRRGLAIVAAEGA
jgi:hypothetical protein